MRSSKLFKTLLLASGLAAGVALACGESLDDLLLDALCDDDGDCAPGQNCVRTEYQLVAGAQGWCRNDNSCAAGAQPGCACAQNGAVFECNPTTEQNIDINQPSAGCECQFVCNQNTWPGTGCPQNLTADMDSGTSGSQCVCVPNSG